MSDYQTFVKALPSPVLDDESLPEPCVIMSCHVRRLHSLPEAQGGIEHPIFDHGFWYRAEHPSAPFESRDHSPSSPSWAIVSSMMDAMRLPFRLDRISWRGGSQREDATWTRVTRDELVSEIARVASLAVNDPRNEGRKGTQMLASIMHRVAVSECAICMEGIGMGDQLVRTGCSHKFHKACIEPWLRINQTCPSCRCKLSTKKLRDLGFF